ACHATHKPYAKPDSLNFVPMISIAELIAIKVADLFAMFQIGAHGSVPLGANVRAKEPYPLVRAPQAVPHHVRYLGRHEVACFRDNRPKSAHGQIVLKPLRFRQQEVARVPCNTTDTDGKKITEPRAGGIGRIGRVGLGPGGLWNGTAECCD